MLLRKAGILAMILAGFIIMSCGAQSEDKSNFKVLTIKSIKKGEGDKPGDFTWEENGKTYSFSSLTKNKVVFLNFWGTWCGPCRQEIPDIIETVKEMKGKDVIFIGMAGEKTTPAEAIQKVQEFGTAKGINYINFISSREASDAFGGIYAVPTTFIIDKQGNFFDKIVGGRTKAQFIKTIEDAMNSKPGSTKTESKSNFKVFPIKAVKKGETNKPGDFSWEEDGKTFNFSSLTKNKVVFLNFWGTWCGPCRQEIPDIIEVVNAMKGRDVVFIGMADEKSAQYEALRKVKEFGTSKGINYLNFLSNQAASDAFGGINAVPTTFIIDKKGNIIEKIIGGRTKADFLKSIDRALK